MDEFMFVLLAGLLMIIVMLFAWGVPEENGENETYIEDFTGTFTVGSGLAEAPKTMRFGDFEVSYALGSDEIATKGNIEIKRNIISETKQRIGGRIDEDMNLVNSGYITIDILDTNSAGKLIVKVNDNTVYNAVAYPGRLDIQVDKSYLTDYNILEISTTIPGLKFWSSSIYKIENVEFGINFFGNKEMFDTFELYRSELDNLEYGEITFEVEGQEGSGDLLIKINNYRVFKGVPSHDFSEKFYKYDVGLISGYNTIAFSCDKGVTYDLDDVELYIFYKEEEYETRTFSFKVTSGDYKKLKSGDKGKIKFYIEDCNYDGDLKLYTTDVSKDRHNLVTIDDYEEEEYKTVYFDENDVDIGTNKLTFEATDEGIFTLSNLEIEI